MRGFPGVVKGLLDPLNNKPKFKKKYRNKHFKALLNPNDGKLAALVVVSDGNVDVESIKNTPEENIKKKNAGWNAKLETTTPIFLDIAMGRLSIIGIVVKVLTRKVKLRGIRKLLKLLNMFEMLSEDQEKTV